MNAWRILPKLLNYLIKNKVKALADKPWRAVCVIMKIVCLLRFGVSLCILYFITIYTIKVNHLMDLLKKLLLAAVISMTAISPAALAAGKIKNATVEEVSQAIDDAIRLSGETLAAVEGNVEKAEVLKMLKATKQASKRIESNVVDRLRSKANGKIAKARSAIKKDDNEKAAVLLTEAVAIFKEVKTKHQSF